MPVLHAMRADQFDDFLARAVEGYAHDNVASGRWPEADALALARAETTALLKQGLQTPGHRLFHIVPAGSATTVGYLWLASFQRGSLSVAYVYQLLVLPEFRRQGHGRAALRDVEVLAREAGHHVLSLTVFASNGAARALYAAAGFQPVNLSLAKVLCEGTGPSSTAPQEREGP